MMTTKSPVQYLRPCAYAVLKLMLSLRALELWPGAHPKPSLPGRDWASCWGRQVPRTSQTETPTHDPVTAIDALELLSDLQGAVWRGVVHNDDLPVDRAAVFERVSTPPSSRCC